MFELLTVTQCTVASFSYFMFKNVKNQLVTEYVAQSHKKDYKL